MGRMSGTVRVHGTQVRHISAVGAVTVPTTGCEALGSQVGVRTLAHRQPWSRAAVKDVLMRNHAGSAKSFDN